MSKSQASSIKLQAAQIAGEVIVTTPAHVKEVSVKEKRLVFDTFLRMDVGQARQVALASVAAEQSMTAAYLSLIVPLWEQYPHKDSWADKKAVRARFKALDVDLFGEQVQPGLWRTVKSICVSAYKQGIEPYPPNDPDNLYSTRYLMEAKKGLSGGESAVDCLKRCVKALRNHDLTDFLAASQDDVHFLIDLALAARSATFVRERVNMQRTAEPDTTAETMAVAAE